MTTSYQNRFVFSFATVLLCILLSTPTLAQCKLKVDDTDKITGERHRKSWVILSKRPELHFITEKTGNNIKFNTSYYTTGVDETVIKTGDKVIVKFENGEVLELECTSDTQGKSQVYGGSVITVFNAFYGVDEATLELFSQQLVTFVRVVHGEQNFDYELKTKISDKLKQQMACMLF